MVYPTVEFYVKKQVLIAACLLVGNVLIGYNSGWSSPVLEKLLDENQPAFENVVSYFEASWVASAYLLGMIIGLLICGNLANAIGRKSSIIVMSLVTLFSFVIIAMATNVWWLYVGRAVKGCGSIGLQMLNAIIIAELASPNLRGMFLALEGVCHSLGILLAYIVGSFASIKWISYIYIAMAFIHVSVCGYFVPESPIFYVSKGKVNEAKHILQELGRSEDIDTELKEMIETHKEDRTSSKLSQLFATRSNRRAILVTLVLGIINQAGGSLTFLYFATMIFRESFSSIEPIIATMILGVTLLAGSMIAPLFINRCGRRTLLLISSACCSLIVSVMGAFCYLELINHPIMPHIRWLPIVILTSFMISFSIGANLIPMTMISEMFRPDLRGIASAVTMIGACGAGLLVTANFTEMCENIGDFLPFWTHGLINVLGFLFILFFVPETKGKGLMETGSTTRQAKQETSAV